MIISWSAFSTRILWDWIHYAYARPAEWDSSLLRMKVLTDLSVPRWKPADIKPVEDVTEVWKEHLKTNTSLTARLDTICGTVCQLGFLNDART